MPWMTEHLLDVNCFRIGKKFSYISFQFVGANIFSKALFLIPTEWVTNPNSTGKLDDFGLTEKSGGR